VADTNEITRRWEEGVDHDPRSIEIFKGIAKIDLEIGGDYFCWKYGGDGDNGEHLLFELDIYFESLSPPPEELERDQAAMEASSAAATHALAALDEDRVLYDSTEVEALRDVILKQEARIKDLTEACIGEMNVDAARLRAAMDESTLELKAEIAKRDEKIAAFEAELAKTAYLDDGQALSRRVYEAFLASFREAGDKMGGLSHYMEFVQNRWAHNLRTALRGSTSFIFPS
jgi:hypothetical protein